MPNAYVVSLLVALVGFGVGCSTDPAGGNGSGGGGGGTTSSTTGQGGGGGGPSSGIGGSGGSGATGGGGGASACPDPLPEVGEFSFTLDGETVACVDWGTHQIVIEGAIRGSLADGWTIDACAPNTACAPLESVIAVVGSGLDVTIPEGAFVRATVTTGKSHPTGMGEHCRQHLVIENLPNWGGLANPVASPAGTSESALWVAGHFGVSFDIDEPYAVAAVPVCKAGSVDDVYDLRFDSPDSPSSSVAAPWGQTVDWSVAAGAIAGQYRVRTLYARDECCHLAEMHAYWVARAPSP